MKSDSITQAAYRSLQSDGHGPRWAARGVVRGAAAVEAVVAGIFMHFLPRGACVKANVAANVSWQLMRNGEREGITPSFWDGVWMFPQRPLKGVSLEDLQKQLKMDSIEDGEYPTLGWKRSFNGLAMVYATVDKAVVSEKSTKILYELAPMSMAETQDLHGYFNRLETLEQFGGTKMGIVGVTERYVDDKGELLPEGYQGKVWKKKLYVMKGAGETGREYTFVVPRAIRRH